MANAALIAGRGARQVDFRAVGLDPGGELPLGRERARGYSGEPLGAPEQKGAGLPDALRMLQEDPEFVELEPSAQFVESGSKGGKHGGVIRVRRQAEAGPGRNHN